MFLNTYTFIALLNYSALPTFRQTDNLYIVICAGVGKPNLVSSASGSTSSCYSTILNDAPKPACDNRPNLTLSKCSISEVINPNETSNNSASKNAEVHNSNIWLKKILAESLFTVARMHTQYDKHAQWSHKSRSAWCPEPVGIIGKRVP